MIIFLLFVLFNSAQAFPNFLTLDEVNHEHNLGLTWDCFFTSQIKQIECEEWIEESEFGKSEKSDIDFIVETDNAIYSYGFNNAHHVCREIKKDMQSLLKGQKYFCVMGNEIHAVRFEVKGKMLKPVLDRAFQCMKTPIGSVSWSGGMGPCLD